MTLGDFELLPGIVISADDPTNQGRVKACAPGLFDNLTMTIDDMLWINPFCTPGQQFYSKLNINSKIWILHNRNNYFEYWYIPMFEYNENIPDFGGQDADVLIARSVEGQLIQVYYTQKDGIRLVNGDSSVQLLPNGDVKTGSKNSVITCTADGQIKLEKIGSSLYSAVLGEKLVSLLEQLGANLNELGNTLNSSFFINSSCAQTAWKAGTSLVNNAKGVKSDVVKLS